MKRRATLIQTLKSIVEQPYRNYAIGLTDNNGKYYKTDGEGAILVFNCRDDEETMETFTYYMERGMVTVAPIGERTKYLYIYRLYGEKGDII